MGLVEDVRLLRLFTDALEVVDGVALFGGIPFNGVGVAQDSSGRCELLSYVDGLVVGPFVEPLLDSDQSLLVFEDESQTILVEDMVGFVRFEGELFTGFAVERDRSDSRYLGLMLGFVNGVCSQELVEWYPGGQLATFQRYNPYEDRDENQLFQWHSDGSMAYAKYGLTLNESRHSTSTSVEADESGRLVAIDLGEWGDFFERLPSLRDSPRYKVFFEFEELAGFRVGSTLRLGPIRTSDWGLPVLLADGAMDDLEEITCHLSADRLREVLALPKLRKVKFYLPHHPPSAESRELLLVWQAASPGRELEI